eukprot:TRINITY_DN3139_c0_g2_i2.p1 TRINITY_DN3139_c0_g2~~TRINITY_DN3139_c0_g2_i2.p1  ORF type:complete len:267 (+),score=58.15 TRINITY_DN3139_c0_g2_i2:281-1081(+)
MSSLSVTLQARLPTSETISIEAEAAEEMTKVKGRIALSGGLDVDCFTLAFEGEVVGDDDGQLVKDLPFEDGSLLEITISKKQVALRKLAEKGMRGRQMDDILSAFAPDPFRFIGRYLTQKVELELCEALTLILDAAQYKEEELEVTLLNLVQRNSVDATELFLTRTPVDVNCPTLLKKPLHSACAVKNSSMISLLLSHGADVHSRSSDNRTPLHFAAQRQHNYAVKTLLACGADRNAKDRFGYTPLAMVPVTGWETVCLLLQEKDC